MLERCVLFPFLTEMTGTLPPRACIPYTETMSLLQQPRFDSNPELFAELLNNEKQKAKKKCSKLFSFPYRRVWKYLSPSPCLWVGFFSPQLADISDIRGFWSVIPHHNLCSPHPFCCLHPSTSHLLFTPSSFHHPMVVPSDGTRCGPAPLWRNGQWGDEEEQREGGWEEESAELGRGGREQGMRRWEKCKI